MSVGPSRWSNLCQATTLRARRVSRVFLARFQEGCGIDCWLSALSFNNFTHPSSTSIVILTQFKMALDTLQLRDKKVRDRIRLATEFLDPTDPRARSYRGDIVLMLNRGLRRLVVSIDDIRSHSRELADDLLFQPFDHSLAFDAALKTIITTIPNRANFEQDEDTLYYVAYSGSFGENSCSPRTLGSSLLNRMVCLEGIVTKCSLVRPKVVKSVHWNEKNKTFLFREYRDQTMTANGPASSSVYPQEDGEGNPVCPSDPSRRSSY